MNYQEILGSAVAEGGTFPPCFAFSIHKSGSSLLASMILGVCKQSEIPALSVPGVMVNHGVAPGQWSRDAALIPYFQRPMVHFGFRSFPAILGGPEIDIRSKKCVLLVRDPRDALVSAFYSYGGQHFTHKLPAEHADKVLQRASRKPGFGQPIDEYVLASAAQHKRKLMDYKNALNPDNSLIRRYEDVYFDKTTFLAEIFSHFGIEVNPDVLARVAERNDIRPSEEDQSKHIRKGTPGDHREKLKPETIRQLNEQFRQIGAWYGYQLE